MFFSILASYQWKSKDQKTLPNSELAIKEIVKSIDSHFSKKKLKNGEDYKIIYKRLRASAGDLILNKIYKRISNANSIIVDISHPNPNVYLELGVAMALSIKSGGTPSIYLIREKQSKEFIEPPSDLKGFYISEYVFERNKIVFKDQGSLRMSLISEIKEYFIDFQKLNDLANEVVNSVN
jgi:hypothetical protein